MYKPTYQLVSFRQTLRSRSETEDARQAKHSTLKITLIIKILV